MKYEEIQSVCKELGTVDIKGKDYVQVNQRVIAFRKLFPEGMIETEIVKLEDGVCVIKAMVYDGSHLMATGHAYEKEGSTFINKTSYIENAETSAVGRALGFLGIGIDESIASAEEVETAILNQGSKDPVAEDAIARKVILALGANMGKDEAYTIAWCEKLFGNTYKWEQFTEPMLAKCKVELSKKLQKQHGQN